MVSGRGCGRLHPLFLLAPGRRFVSTQRSHSSAEAVAPNFNSCVVVVTACLTCRIDRATPCLSPDAVPLRQTPTPLASHFAKTDRKTSSPASYHLGYGIWLTPRFIVFAPSLAPALRCCVACVVLLLFGLVSQEPRGGEVPLVMHASRRRSRVESVFQKNVSLQRLEANSLPGGDLLARANAGIHRLSLRHSIDGILLLIVRNDREWCSLRISGEAQLKQAAGQ